MNGKRLLCSLLLVSAALPVWAQSAREAAVAIDRVPIPPNDPFEVEQVGPPMASPWSLAFLPDGTFLWTGLRNGAGERVVLTPEELQKLQAQVEI